jgi:hypothetical protein
MIQLATFPTPHYSAKYQLGANTYAFDFAHNQRSNRWYVTIRDLDGGQIAGNRKLVQGVNLLLGATHVNRPPGALYVVSTTSDDSPRLDDLGEGLSFALVYVP